MKNITATGRWPQPFQPQASVLVPRPYQSSVIKTAIAMDFAKGEDFMSAVLAKLSSDGTVMIEQIHHFARGMGKSYMRQTIHSLSDMYAAMKDPYPSRSGRNRHYKAKAQPNCGPRGNNPW